MKFGETLSRRSVPQWRTHDLEYDEIKTLIKVQTSSQDGCSREFEKTLLGVLDSELERVHNSPPELLMCRLMSLYDAKPEKSRDDYPPVNELSKLYPRSKERTMATPNSHHNPH